MRLHVIGALLLIALATVDGRTALACGSGKVIFEDNFLTLNPGLPQQDPRRTNGADGLTYKLTPDDKTRYFLYESDFYKDYEVCGLFTSQVSSSDVHPDSLTDNPAEGIIFWATDGNNFYAAFVYPSDGSFAIFRSKDGNLLQPVPPRAESAVNKGTSTTNEMRVSVQGKTATLFINGKKVLDLPGTPPESGSVFGFIAVADNGTVTVKDIQLREVEGAPQSNQVAEQSPPANSQPAPPVQPPAPAPANTPQPAGPPQPPAPASGQSAQPPVPASGAQSATPVKPPAPASGAQATAEASPPAAATPSTSAAASPGKPLPPVDGVSVALGDPRERVAQAYPAAINLGGGNLAIADGIKLFFTPKAPVVLGEIMVEDPYKGTIEGIKIGATADDVVAARGKPDDIRPVFGGSGYVYYYAGGNFVRYDVDEKSKKVTDIVQMLVSR